MADTSQLQPFNATCGGGLVLNKDVYDMQPGEALQLINFDCNVFYYTVVKICS